jgi:CMP-N,N'-diacetyllegionaminic acid synthase
VQDVVAVVPARGGSKGIPRKNLREFLGQPLAAWTIKVAQEAGVRVVVTSDDGETVALSVRLDAEVVLRPGELAGDDVPTAAAVRHALLAVCGDEPYVLVLEPTSPGRRAAHVCEAAELLRAGADSVASVSEMPHHYFPEKALRVREDGTIVGADGTAVRDMVHRRQDLRVAYAFDGIVFGCRRELVLGEPPTVWGESVAALVVDPRHAVDLDRPEDWAPAEAKLRAILLPNG